MCSLWSSKNRRWVRFILICSLLFICCLSFLILDNTMKRSFQRNYFRSSENDIDEHSWLSILIFLSIKNDNSHNFCFFSVVQFRISLGWVVCWFRYFSFIQGKNPKACTIILRGAGKDVLQEVERNLNDALCVVRNITLDPRLVPGGGTHTHNLSLSLSLFLSHTLSHT